MDPDSTSVDLTGVGRRAAEEDPEATSVDLLGVVAARSEQGAVQSPAEARLKGLVGGELLIPVPEDTDPAVHPGRPGFPWRPAAAPGGALITLYSSPERLREAHGQAADFLRFPFGALLRYWPDKSCGLALDPGTPETAVLPGERVAVLSEWADQQGAQRLAEAGFEPQNEVEERLFDAVLRQDREAFFKVLLGGQVLMPVQTDTPWGTRPDDAEFPWQPVPVQNRPSIMVFTSLKWMHDAVGQCRFVMPEVHDLVAAWPMDQGWGLVLNPGTPIDAVVPGDQIHGLAAGVLSDTEPEPPAFEPGNRIDQDLHEAAEAGDTDSFLRVLFSANVLVPIPPQTPLEASPASPGFSWEAALRDPASVQVFTSVARLKEVLGQDAARFVYADFRDLIAAWPDPSWTMLLNPGTRIGASLAGDQVTALSEWAARVGLLEPATSDVPPVQSVPQERLEPVASPVPEQRRAGPTLMQKVLPPEHVGWYLEQGYDRVGGFVYPAEYVADLQTPAQIYETLGLLYEGSPFSPTDEGVHVIRWPAHCEELYRIPFGGQTEAELTGWGDSGWVVEQPPFQGAGFAPGSAGTIREYKVDSARLPYGAEMYYLGRDRSERFVAMYDPDRLEWVRAGGGEQ